MRRPKVLTLLTYLSRGTIACLRDAGAHSRRRSLMMGLVKDGWMGSPCEWLAACNRLPAFCALLVIAHEVIE
jgi:hypothetical protein